MRSFAVLLAVAAAAALQQDTFCSIGVTGKANDDKNYTLTMFTKAPVPKYNFRSCSFSVSNDIITSNLTRIFDTNGWCGTAQGTGCKMTSQYSFLCQCGCMGSDVPSTGCNFNWNATVKISSDAENIRCECSP